MSRHRPQKPQLVVDCRRLAELLDPLRRAVAAGSAPGDGTYTARPKPGSRPPIRLEVVDLIVELESEAPLLANTVRGYLGLEYRRVVKGDVTEALEGLAYLHERLEAELPDTAENVREVVAFWLRRTESLLGLREAPRRLPVPCPYCRRGSLRLFRESGDVACIARDCRDEDGRPFVWRRDEWTRAGLVIRDQLEEEDTP